jgi:hypothetical protein
MWEFDSLRFASACERGGSRCARIEFRRGLEDPGCLTWLYRDPEFFCRFIPAGAAVARSWRRQCWENRRPDIAVGQLGGRIRGKVRIFLPRIKTCPLQLSLWYSVLK